MRLLMSDTVLIDPLLDETLRRWGSLGASAHPKDVALDPYERAVPDPSN